LAQKRVRESADKPAMKNDSLLAAQLKVVEQEKGRRILIIALKAREEATVNRDGNMESDVEGTERRA
jgi:hypothetical protein